MANTIQFKRRSAGNAGAPAALKSGEVAHNEVDDTLYIGKGDDGSGNATAIAPLAGRGAFVDLGNSQSISGAKTVISPFLTGCICRTYAAIFIFMAGVMPPMPMFGRSLLYVQSHCVA